MYKILNIVQTLIAELNKSGVKYCHWKSNINLDMALAGYGDLDLLVAKQDSSRFESLILSLNFKSFIDGFVSFPSIKHFYGYDEETGKLVHLHVYYKLITGPHLTKSYDFDFEKTFLENHLTQSPSGMPIPQRSVEFVLYVIRTMTKFSCVFEHLMYWKDVNNISHEIDYLYDEHDGEKIKCFLHNYFPSVSLKLIKECMSSMSSQNHIRLFCLGKRLCRKIYLYKRLSRLDELAALAVHAPYRISNKLLFHQKKRRSDGGVMIAILGLDASGKTTIANELHQWLSENFTTSLIHVGKPPSSTLTFFMNVLISFVKSFKKELSRTSIKSDCSKISLPLALRLLTLAYDRMRLTRRFWRKSIKGNIVICDRYPSTNIGVMDSQRMQPTHFNGLKRVLAHWEQKCYASIPKPDIILQLHVPVEIAIERNDSRNKVCKENEEFIQSRYKENSDLNYDSRVLYSINTTDEYDKVIGKLKKIVWQNL